MQTIHVGTVLQGDGGVSTGAVVLDHKEIGSDLQLVMCVTPGEFLPFVVWKYWEETGGLTNGSYHSTVTSALDDFNNR